MIEAANRLAFQILRRHVCMGSLGPKGEGFGNARPGDRAPPHPGALSSERLQGKAGRILERS